MPASDAGVVELVDALDSKSCSERSVGSIPTARTTAAELGRSEATTSTLGSAAAVARATTDGTALPGRSPPREPVLHTPDRRYIVVRGRLWRAANPHLSEADRQRHVDALMAARRAVRDAQTDEARRAARAAVDAAKRALGERGPVWWTDGAPDENRRMVGNTAYADWYVRAI